MTERFRIPTDVMSRAVGEELVLLDLASGTYFGLNTVGAALWRSLSAGKTLPEAIDALAEEFDAPRSRVEEDARALVTQLLENGLIKTGE